MAVLNETTVSLSAKTVAMYSTYGQSSVCNLCVIIQKECI